MLPPGTPASEEWGDYHVRLRFRLANTIYGYGDGPAILLRKSGDNFYVLRVLNDPSGKAGLYLKKVVGWDGYLVNLLHAEKTKGVLLGHRQLGIKLEKGWHTLVVSLTAGQIAAWLDGQQALAVSDPRPGPGSRDNRFGRGRELICRSLRRRGGETCRIKEFFGAPPRSGGVPGRRRFAWRRGAGNPV